MEDKQPVIEVFMPMKTLPRTTHRTKSVKVVQRNGKHVPQFYEKPELKKTRQLFMNGLVEHVPKEKIMGPVRLTTWWLFGSNGRHKDGSYKLTRPDTDNSIKLLKDCMSDSGFWKDDAQVVLDVIGKYWADTPGIYVKIEPLEES